MANRIEEAIVRLEAEGALPKTGPPITLEDRCTHALSEMLNDQAPLFEERYRPAARQIIHTVGRDIRRELLNEMSRLDVEADQLVHIEGDRWYNQREILAALDRICPED